MKKIVNISRISAKESFKNLRKNWPYFCKILENQKIVISNMYFRHISWYWRKRELKETILRFLMIPLIYKILNEWEIREKREAVSVEWKKYLFSYKISLKIKNEIFSLIILEKEENNKKELKLISSFVESK